MRIDGSVAGPRKFFAGILKLRSIRSNDYSVKEKGATSMGTVSRFLF